MATGMISEFSSAKTALSPHFTDSNKHVVNDVQNGLLTQDSTYKNGSLNGSDHAGTGRAYIAGDIPLYIAICDFLALLRGTKGN